MQVLPYAGLFCFRLESEPAIDLPEKAYGPREGLKKLCVMIREKMDFSVLPSEPGEEMILEMMICQIRGLQEMLLSSGELNVRDYLQRVRTFLDLLALSVRSVGGITAL